jgi:hypothetical protein
MLVRYSRFDSFDFVLLYFFWLAGMMEGNRLDEGASVQAYVSLRSADLLGPGACIDRVAAVRRRTSLPLDVHLNVTDPDHWARRFIDVGADMVTVQSGSLTCPT